MSAVNEMVILREILRTNKERNLTPNTILLLMIILDRANVKRDSGYKCWLSAKEIAASMGVSKPTYDRLVGSLAKDVNSVIKVERRLYEGTNGSQTSILTIDPSFLYSLDCFKHRVNHEADTMSDTSYQNDNTSTDTDTSHQNDNTSIINMSTPSNQNDNGGIINMINEGSNIKISKEGSNKKNLNITDSEDQISFLNEKQDEKQSKPKSKRKFHDQPTKLSKDDYLQHLFNLRKFDSVSNAFDAAKELKLHVDINTGLVYYHQTHSSNAKNLMGYVVGMSGSGLVPVFIAEQEKVVTGVSDEGQIDFDEILIATGTSGAFYGDNIPF